uniref:G_PROTEIN_RECEP_F1_2 domain-containing protein n=3 Tax=Caenorhabditis japonica TaxID=281687 RepID=A0A8R1HNN4_CAEJA
MTSSNSTSRVSFVDVIIFGGLESLGICAILGNLALIIVLLNNKYLHRASFILMLNLAIADVIHGFVTTCHFYPPILFKEMHIGELAIRLFNIADWTAWAITLTHMSAICLDRLIAIILYGRYNVLVTVHRIKTFSLLCWAFFLSTNVTLFFVQACCMIRPLESLNYYSFGYADTKDFNVYVLTYTPVEILTILILSFSNPITLVQLYRRHKRKIALRQQGASKSVSTSSSSLLKQQRSQWQRASTMLLEMSMKMGSKHIANDVREMAARRSNRQQQRILLQITVVALIFYAYMTAYYVSYYSRFQSIAVMIFNSYFYSITHMINPVIYFSLNKEMRAQLREAFVDFRKLLNCKKKDPYVFANSSTKINHSTKMTSTSAAQKTEERSLDSMENSTGNESAEIRAIVQNDEQSDQCSLPKSDIYMTPPVDIPVNKMGAKERSTFINKLVSALQYASNKSLASVKGQNGVAEEKMETEKEQLQPVLRKLDKSATTNDISSMIKQRYIRFSNTLQVISRDSYDNLLSENPKYISMGSLERSCLLNDMSGNSDSTSSTVQKTVTRSHSSTSNSIFHNSITNCNVDTDLFDGTDIGIDTDAEDEIAYL